MGRTADPAVNGGVPVSVKSMPAVSSQQFRSLDCVEKLFVNASCLGAGAPRIYAPQSLTQMDTLSRDSNSSGSILPLVGVIAGGLALVLSIVALVKLSAVQKTTTELADSVNAKVTSMESSVTAATS